MAKKKKKGRKPASKKKSPARKNRSTSLVLLLAALVAVVVIAYSPVFDAGFVDMDDSKLILDKAQKFSRAATYFLKFEYGTPYYKPVTYLTWRAEYRAVGASPFLFHFNNLILHLLNCLLVFFIIRHLSQFFEQLKRHAVPVAFASALLFALHPLHVESVAWVVERKDVLFTFFYLIGIGGYLMYLHEKKWWPLAVSVFAYMLSIFSKAPGITLPAVLFLIDYAMGRNLSARLFYEKVGYFGVFVFALVAFGVFSRSGGEGSVAALVDSERKLAKADNISESPSFWGKTTLASMRAVLWYAHSWLPFRMSLGYPREAIIGFFGAAINIFPLLLAGGAALLLKLRRRYPLLFFAHAFFFITLSPSIARLGLGIGIFMSDRYVYLPVMGLTFLIAAWVITLNEKGWLTQRIKYGAIGAIALIFAIMTFQMSKTWKSPETLWSNVIEKFPNVDYAYVNRGSWYRDQGELQKAKLDLDNAIMLDDNANSRIQRGLVNRQLGQSREAILDYTRAIGLDPGSSQAYINRGNAYLDTRQFQLALADYNAALGMSPNSPRILVNRAIAFASLRDFPNALNDFNRAEKINPGYSDIYINRAILYVESGQYRNAVKDYEKHLQYFPNDHQVLNDLGTVLQILNDHQAAVQRFTQAIGIQPDRLYFQGRARSYDALGRSAEAQRDRQSAGG